MPTPIANTGKRSDARLVKQQPPKKAKAKQQDLPTLEKRDIPEIEKAAEDYKDARDERMELSKTEAEKKALLIGVMRKNNRTDYSYNGLPVTLSSVDNVKVKSEKEESEDE